MIIRNAVIEDIEDMADIGFDLRNEGLFKNSDYDYEKVANLLHDLITQPYGIAVVVEKNSEIVGALVGAVMPHYFGQDLMSFDYAVIIKPEHRGGSTAARLIAEYIRQAKEKGAKIIMLAPSVDINTERTAALYEHLDFRRIGYVMVHQVKG